MPWNYRSVSDLSITAAKMASHVPHDALVVGVPRSGVLLAALVATHAGASYLDLPSFVAGHDTWSGLRHTSEASFSQIVVLDDTVNSGSELARVRSAIPSRPGSPVVRYGAGFATTRGTRHVDFYGEIVDLPRVFEWNLLHHEQFLQECLMDIDGVLCPDPSPRQNDDGRRYAKFIREAPVVYRPAFPVKGLVTSRLERYREATEEWLHRSGVAYGELLMLDLPSARERQRTRAHATHKATIFAASNATVFVESDLHQASIIHSVTGKDVFCTDLRVFLSGRPGRQRPTVLTAARGAARAVLSVTP